MVGGTSKIPAVRRFVAERLSRDPEPFDKVHPMTCVAQGAAIVSAILQGAPGLDHYAYSVKLEHSLCANPVDESGRSFLDPIIKRGTDIPCSYTKTYFPVADPAERITVSVYEGDVTVLDGGALQFDLQGYEGDQVVPYLAQLDVEQDGSLRQRIWSIQGAERTLVLEARQQKVPKRNPGPKSR